MSTNYNLEVERLKRDWAENPRWKGIKRGYSAEDVVRLRGSVHIEHTLAKRAATSLLTASRVGTSTLPPMWPHFLAAASWSSK